MCKQFNVQEASEGDGIIADMNLLILKPRW